MAKFTKYNNPNRRKIHRRSSYSKQYISEQREEMFKALASCKSDAEKDAVIKAYSISINP